MVNNSKIRISNPQTLNGEWFYIHGILYTVTDFRWDGGWGSGDFKGYLTANISHPPLPKASTVDIFFCVDTPKGEIRFESHRASTSSIWKVTIPIKGSDDLKNRDGFKSILSTGVKSLFKNNSELNELVSSSDLFRI